VPRWVAPCVLAAVVLLGLSAIPLLARGSSPPVSATPLTPASPSTATSATTASAGLYRAPQAIDAYVAKYPELEAIARQPQFTWLGEHDGPDVVRRLVTAARGETVPLVLYAIPDRDLGSHSAGGFGSDTSYLAWVRSMAAAIGSAPAIVVVEPDAIGQSQQLAVGAAQARLTTIAEVAAILHAEAPGAKVYLDASTWVPAARMAALLKQAGVALTSGVALNVANYVDDAQVFAYGNALSPLIGGLHYIVDSSRNGLGVGPDPTAWCNVPGRALGATPGTRPPGEPLSDGQYWIKHPGVSDGRCNGGPPAGTVWAAAALDLVRNAAP
jgi:endoglucanase